MIYKKCFSFAHTLVVSMLLYYDVCKSESSSSSSEDESESWCDKLKGCAPEKPVCGYDSRLPYLGVFDSECIIYLLNCNQGGNFTIIDMAICEKKRLYDKAHTTKKVHLRTKPVTVITTVAESEESEESEDSVETEQPVVPGTLKRQQIQIGIVYIDATKRTTKRSSVKPKLFQLVTNKTTKPTTIATSKKRIIDLLKQRARYTKKPIPFVKQLKPIIKKPKLIRKIIYKRKPINLKPLKRLIPRTTKATTENDSEYEERK